MREILPKSAIPEGRPIRMLEPSTYLRRIYRVKSKCFMTVPLQNGELLAENVPATTVSLRREAGGFVVHHHTIGDGRVDLGEFSESTSPE